MTGSITIDEFTALVSAAQKRNSLCVYCGRELKNAALPDVMYMRGSKRIACKDCPEAMVIEFPKATSSSGADL